MRKNDPRRWRLEYDVASLIEAEFAMLEEASTTLLAGRECDLETPRGRLVRALADKGLVEPGDPPAGYPAEWRRYVVTPWGEHHLAARRELTLLDAIRRLESVKCPVMSVVRAILIGWRRITIGKPA